MRSSEVEGLHEERVREAARSEEGFWNLLVRHVDDYKDHGHSKVRRMHGNIEMDLFWDDDIQGLNRGPRPPQNHMQRSKRVDGTPAVATEAQHGIVYAAGGRATISLKSESILPDLESSH